MTQRDDESDRRPGQGRDRGGKERWRGLGVTPETNK